MMAQSTNRSTVETLTHTGATRKNIPTAEYQAVMHHEQKKPIQIPYERRNRDLDPQLVWRGKDEQDWSDLVVQAPPLYIQEKVHPKVLIDDLAQYGKAPAAQAEQLDLFADFNGVPEEADKTDFYQHDQNWTNRMILGDSLQVMASLAEREGLRGQVQCIYLDPPYGIKFNSNFQWSTTSRDVKDGNTAHITREPEQVKAFRDTWRDGIHSYLTYLRDRLTVARDLLTESGSIFVQIGDENVHRVRAVMDEVFGDENFISEIFIQKTTSQSSDTLSNVGDIIIWFAKSKPSMKYHGLFFIKELGGDGVSLYSHIEEGYYIERRMTSEERIGSVALPDNARIFGSDSLVSQRPPGDFPVTLFGETYRPGRGYWKTGESGFQNLYKANRIIQGRNALSYRRYIDDFPAFPMSNIWSDTVGQNQFGGSKIYVVQTALRVVERCILMATDPGDLVLDPTCVRKGTLVLTPLNLPKYGGKVAAPSLYSGRVGEGLVAPTVSHDIAQNTPLNPPEYGGKGITPSPYSGLAGEGLAGEGLAGEGTTFRAVPIEQLQPGDFVYAHDGQCHRVVRTLKRTYQGEMIGIRHEGSDEILWTTADHLILSQRRTETLNWSDVPTTHFGRARELRKEASLPERILWQKLRGEQVGVKFRRQHPIGPYIADFYTREAGLVVEVDGSTHQATLEAIAYDRDRDRYMQAQGLRVLRFSAGDVTRTPWAVAEAIADACRERVLAEDATKQWRFAGQLAVGDLVFSGLERTPRRIVAIERQTTVEEVYDLEVEAAHSFLTTVCAIHNCGSGTTAYVAEQWGRRWITIDTSRVALALARARIMGARYPYYLLADSRAGQIKEAEVTKRAAASQPTYGNIRHGFVYERVPHITLKAIANNAEIDVIWERWQPRIAETLAALNGALRGHQTPFAVTTGGRAGASIRFDAPADATFTMPSGETAPAFALVEWEVPREKPADWPPSTDALLADFWSVRIARQGEIDASIAAKADFEYLYDRPYEDKKTVRVAGPFTVESLSPHRVLGVDEDDELIDTLKESKVPYGVIKSFPEMVLENLRTAGVQQAHKADKIDFTRLVPWPGDLVCAEGRYLEEAGTGGNGAAVERRAAIFIGPEFGTVQRSDLAAAAREAGEAGFDVLITCAFAYEAHTTDFSKLGRLSVLKARMNADLHMADDLKNTGKGNLFVIFGEPDIDLLVHDDRQIQVKVNGVDVFNPSTGKVQSDNTDGIACWFIDTDYNEESFFVRHAYFLGASDPYKALKTTLKAEIDEEAWATLNRDTSRPFPRPASGRIAVKVINHLGDEVMKVFRV